MPHKFGKLFIIGFEGTKLTKDLEKKLLELEPAGVIFYDTNIESTEQVKTLINGIKSLLGANLIITVDQEGGKVERLRKICTSLPSLQALGKASKTVGEEYGLEFMPELLIDHSSVLAEELANLGFNLVLAPCADLSTNPLNPIIGTRSLGSDSKLVSKQLRVIIDTYKQYGIKSCVKHFPGHGDTSIDSHLALPVQNYTGSSYQEHLEPFISTIDHDVESVMVAHLVSSLLDEVPATISSAVIKSELRERLRFQGLVISDEITMKALSQYGNYTELAEKMLIAGNNLITWNTNLDEALEVARNLSTNPSKELADAYHQSLKLLASYQWQTKTSDPVENKETKMLRIVENAITWHKPFNELSKSLSQGKTAVLVYDHPKLELPVIQNMFKYDCYQFSGKETSTTFLANYSNLIILSFQTINNSDQDGFIKQLRSDGNWNIVQCSCDMPDMGAELDLFGGNKAHIQGLLSKLAV